MTSNVTLAYPYQLNYIDFKNEVATPMSKHGAWQIVHVALDEKSYTTTQVAKHWLAKAIADNLAGTFSDLLLKKVCPFSEAEILCGIPGDVMHNTQVKLRAINDKNERLQFVFTADLNLVDPDHPLWQNVNVDINYVTVPENNG